MLEDGSLENARDTRYRGWGGTLGDEIMTGDVDLASLEERVAAGEIDPQPVSGRQEALENDVNRFIWNADR